MIFALALVGGVIVSILTGTVADGAVAPPLLQRHPVLNGMLAGGVVLVSLLLGVRDMERRDHQRSGPSGAT
jgi:hypothetical protein